MLNFADNALGSPSHLKLQRKSHEQIMDLPIQADIFIEGWAFGHWFLSLYPNYTDTLNHYFERFEIRTDYQFESIAQAENTIEFFFGKHLAQSIKEKGETRVPEVTGIWLKQI